MSENAPSDPTESSMRVRAVAEELHAYATHFSLRDWNYTRDLGTLEAIRHSNNYERTWPRVRRAVGALFDRSWPEWLTVNRFVMFKVHLLRDKHLPDGVLDDGNIITYWEETGEYLQYVQPSVGALIAEWLLLDSDNPHAVLVAAEMRRIQDAYTARLEETH